MKLSIRKKLIGGFLAVSVLLGTAIGTSYYAINQIDQSYSDLITVRNKILTNSLHIEVDAVKQTNALRGYLLTNSPDALKQQETANQEINELIKQTLPLVINEDVKKGLAELQQLNQEFERKAALIRDLNATDHEQAIRLTQDQAEPLGIQILALASQVTAIQQQFVEEQAALNHASVLKLDTFVFWLSLLSFAAAILTGFLIAGRLSRPIVSIAAAAKRIAEGDLTGEEIRVKTRDEVQELAGAFHQMTGNLRVLIKKVSESSEHLAASTEELTASMQNTSRATEVITSNIHEVATGSEQQVRIVDESSQEVKVMTEGVRQIADNAHMVTTMTQQATSKVEGGNQAIQIAVGQMDAINSTIHQLAGRVQGLGERSREISLIVETISGIAGQTNLLALNAAIEASRAGEEGRGFAVVADEVRKLAEQSSVSAKQITELIHTIQAEISLAVQAMEVSRQEIAAGLRVVHTAGSSFAEVRGSVEAVSEQILVVSAAAEQLSASTEQVLHSMGSIAEVAHNASTGTQLVAASTEEQNASIQEISAATQTLAQMAEELRITVAQFKI